MTKLIHRSGNSNSWTTPHFIYNHYNSIYHFQLDVAADDTNHLCENYYTEETNALVQEWELSNFLNPPYSPNALQKKFVKKSVVEALKDRTTVLLIPSRSETDIWINYVFPLAAQIDFLDERINYSYCENAAGYPSAIVVFDSSAGENMYNRDMGYTPPGHIPGKVQTVALSSFMGYEEYKEKVRSNKLIADHNKREEVLLNQEFIEDAYRVLQEQEEVRY